MNAKESFIKSAAAQNWENIVESATFREAVEHSMLKLATEPMPSLDYLEGAKRLVQILEQIHIPASALKPTKNDNLNHRV